MQKMQGELAFSRMLQYTKANVMEEVPESGGIYRLSYQSMRGSRYLFYIGQASNLRERLLKHLNLSEEDTRIREMVQTASCWFRYVEIPSRDVREEAMKAQVEQWRWKPRFSRQTTSNI